MVLTILSLLVTPYIILVALLFFLSKRREAKTKVPFTSNMLRAPGESLRIKLDDDTQNLLPIVILAGCFPAGFYMLLQVSPTHVGSTIKWLMIVIVEAGLFAYIARMLIRIWNLRLGYYGEVAVGQELDQLMREGCWVFHDIPAGKFNIDHVVVSPAGIFAIETKTSRKLLNKNKPVNAKVIYDGATLKFPFGDRSRYLDQAKRQAIWLGEWLTGTTGEKVSVTPVLAIPGWYVVSSGMGAVRVINPKVARGLVAGSAVIPDTQLKRIVYQLDQRCRDIVPGKPHEPIEFQN